MAVRYEDFSPTLIANTTMQKVFVNEVHKQYRITPNEGYVLHDTSYDEVVRDPLTLEPTGEIKLGYRTTSATCAATYDFVENSREFYAVLREGIPADQIYGVGGNDHEIA